MATQNALWELAKQAFGEDLAEDWMQRPSRLFDGLSPQQKACEESGAEAVMDFIRALIQGSKTDQEVQSLA
ncbi:MAG: MbcA/ParS/Xre antitoxin family protein [Pseudomonadota bacterium]